MSPDGNALVMFSTSSLVGIAGLFSAIWVISAWQKLGIGKTLWWSALRATVQLGLMGFVLAWVFSLENVAGMILMLFIMVLVAGSFNAKRGAGVSHAYWIGVASIFVAALCTMGWMLASGMIPLVGQAVIPLGGMIIGNAMNAVSLTLLGLRREILANEQVLVQMMALGASEKNAVRLLLPGVLQSALTPNLDSLKSVGLIHIPGIAAGMILAGAHPLAAVAMQLVVMFMITASVSIASLTAALLAAPYASRFTGEEG